ncbi:MAG: dihydrofolate reductase [Ruminococcaceae bacterium]|nr:dihydrofolate reductase [Oscillospiraceae bacterium]
MEAIVAVYGDWGIGAGGTQPIVVSADRKHFRDVTGTAAVIVGRKTLADFPGGKPLKNRKNIVLSRRSDLTVEGAVVVGSAEQALAEAAKHERVFVIGGASVYAELFPHIGRVFVTKLSCTPLSDAFFPNLDADPAWTVVDEGEPLEENGITYRFVTYERIPPQ